jgi:hypothetical protein
MVRRPWVSKTRRFGRRPREGAENEEKAELYLFENNVFRDARRVGEEGLFPFRRSGLTTLEVQALKVARTGERRWKILNADKPPKPSKILNVVLTERNALR